MGPTHSLFSGYRDSVPGEGGREGDHSPPSSANAKNEWSCTSTACILLQAVDSYNFTLLFSVRPSTLPIIDVTIKALYRRRSAFPIGICSIGSVSTLFQQQVIYLTNMSVMKEPQFVTMGCISHCVNI